MSSSVCSTCTTGGCTFDELCNGTQIYYACDNTVDIRRVSSIEQAKRKIVRHIDDCIQAIEIERTDIEHIDMKVSEFYIGKTYIRRIKKRGGGYSKINPMDPETWRKDGIRSCWKYHRDQGYGEDGMVVLAVVTRGALPPNTTDSMYKEDYAIALEQQILHHYVFDAPHEKLVNETFNPGKLDDDKSAAYAIYMAFRLEETDSSEQSDDTEESSDSDQQYRPEESKGTEVDQQQAQAHHFLIPTFTISANYSPNTNI